MERHFEIDLSELKERLLWMGSLAERAVHQAIHAVLEAKEPLAESVLKEESAINELQMEIDDRVMTPLPIEAVAIEKIIFSALQSIVAACAVFPMAYYIPTPHVQADVTS